MELYDSTVVWIAEPDCHLKAGDTLLMDLGSPNQEDFEVASVAPLHGGADERHALRTARPASRAHAPLELIRVVHPEAILATRFEVHAAGERLFDAYIDGVDPPRLAATAPEVAESVAALLRRHRKPGLPDGLASRLGCRRDEAPEVAAALVGKRRGGSKRRRGSKRR